MMVRLEDGGRYYPYSGQASAVVNTLRRAAENAGCRFLFSDRAEEISFAVRLLMRCVCRRRIVQPVSLRMMLMRPPRPALSRRADGRRAGFASVCSPERRYMAKI